MQSDSNSSLTIERCDPARDKSVLALAALVWPEALRAGHWQAVAESLATGQDDAAVLLAAWRGDRLVGAALAQPLPGKAALVWPPQVLLETAAKQCAAGSELIARLCDELQRLPIRIAQTLLAPDDVAAATMMRAGGFTPAAELLYLTADTHVFPEQPLDLSVALEAFQPAGAPRLASLIERTYVGTLDCPQIDGLRATADVLAGYQGVGLFRPELWLLARHDNTDVGCVLVNLHPDVGHAEIVYLGVVPEARGRGLGLDLTRHAQWLARQANCTQTVLAVDAANDPAIRTYIAAGFREFDRKTVWIRALTNSRTA
jgi:ribosomal protein S18 acetylase RimI-like enzyme